VQHVNGRSEENHQVPQSGIRSLAKDLNPGPPAQEAGPAQPVDRISATATDCTRPTATESRVRRPVLPPELTLVEKTLLALNVSSGNSL
jgi:hypothetical protein